MKKYLSIIMAAVLCVLLLVPVGAAAEWVSKDLVSQLDDFPEWVMDADEINFAEQYPGDGMTNAHIGYGSSFNYVYLKADDLGDFTVEFSVNGSTSATITTTKISTANSTGQVLQ